MQQPICNQTKIPKEQWRYGLLTSAFGGCGWIAAYNALVLTGHHVDIPDLISKFLRQYPLLNGAAGTMPDGPTRMVRGFGCRTKTTLRVSEFDSLGKAADVTILYYFWREKLRLGAHFGVFQYRDGDFLGYNLFRNTDTPYPCGESLGEFVRREGFFGMMLTGVWR